MATQTPWGAAQSSKKLAVGVMVYGTASHGGIHLSTKKNALVHYVWRDLDGWYEEDCGWAIVAVTFPELFSLVQDHSPLFATIITFSSSTTIFFTFVLSQNVHFDLAMFKKVNLWLHINPISTS